MAEVFAGCLLERLPHPRQAAALPFFELALRAPLPSFATLARYRKQFKTPPRISLVAPRTSWQGPRGAMRPGPELDAGIDWITRVSDILGAFAIVLATGAELTTGERDQELLRNVVTRLAPTGCKIVVSPRGLWEPEQGVPFAAKSGAIYGFDPMEHDAPPGAFLYGRIRPMGARPRLTEGALAQIAARVAAAGCEQAYLCVESERPTADMKRLAAALAEAIENFALYGSAEAEDAEPDLADSADEDEEAEEGEEDEEFDAEAGAEGDLEGEEDEDLEDEEDEDLEDED